MKTLRTAIMAGLVTAALAVVPTASMAQIPVTDGASIAQQAANFAKEIVQMKNQVDQMRMQYKALTGSFGAGNFLPNAIGEAANSLPRDWQGVYGDATGGSSPYASQADNMMGRFKAKIANMTPTQALDYVQRQRQQKGAYDRVMTQKVYDDQQRDLSNLQRLTSQIDSASSLKDISDLQARISTAQGTIQAEQQKLQAMAMLQKAQDKILQAQQEQVDNKYLYGNGLNDGNWSFPDITTGER